MSIIEIANWLLDESAPSNPAKTVYVKGAAAQNPSDCGPVFSIEASDTNGNVIFAATAPTLYDALCMLHDVAQEAGWDVRVDAKMAVQS